MSWGRSTPKPPPPPQSAIVKLAPLIILFLCLAVFCFIGYHIYLSVQKISATASSKLHENNVVFTKDGLKVGVKHVDTEHYVDATRDGIVKAWNLSTWPGYKSRLWNKQKPADEGTKERKPYTNHPAPVPAK